MDVMPKAAVRAQRVLRSSRGRHKLRTCPDNL